MFREKLTEATTTAPRWGAGTVRQSANVRAADEIASSTSRAVLASSRPITSPVIGLRDTTGPSGLDGGVGPEPRQDLGSANSELAGNRKRRHQTLQREGVIDRDGRELSAGITRGPGGRCGASAFRRTADRFRRFRHAHRGAHAWPSISTVSVDWAAVRPSGNSASNLANASARCSKVLVFHPVQLRCNARGS